MLMKGMGEIISASKDTGWVLEPEAKRLFSMAGMDTPRFTWAKKLEEAVQFADKMGYPVVAKVVSPKIIHKSEVKGVIVGIDGKDGLRDAFERFSRMDGFAGMLVEERVSGIEVFVGGKVDEQFGPVVLFDMGGTGVEIYKDVTLRMAPLRPGDVQSMIRCLKARPLLEGFRGDAPVNLMALETLLGTFSELLMTLETEIESIDLNPVMCSSTRCVVADARIMLKKNL